MPITALPKSIKARFANSINANLENILDPTKLCQFHSGLEPFCLFVYFIYLFYQACFNTYSINSMQHLAHGITLFCPDLHSSFAIVIVHSVRTFIYLYLSLMLTLFYLLQGVVIFLLKCFVCQVQTAVDIISLSLLINKSIGDILLWTPHLRHLDNLQSRSCRGSNRFQHELHKNRDNFGAQCGARAEDLQIHKRDIIDKFLDSPAGASETRTSHFKSTLHPARSSVHLTG